MNTIHSNNLIWDEFNSYHIGKHQVSVDEIVEACAHIVHTEETKFNRLLMVGVTNRGRILSMVFSQKNEDYYLVTARDASKKERRIYAEIQKKYNS